MKESEIVKRLVVASEVCGHSLTESAAEVMARMLTVHDDADVNGAIRKCMERGGRITLAAILSGIDYGHPGAEEAWAICPRDEAATVVWTDEICEAFGVAAKMLESDEVGARMAFRETYNRLVGEARVERRRAKWSVSPGTDAAGREVAIANAIALKRLPASMAGTFGSPALPGGGTVPLLDAETDREERGGPTADDLRALCDKLARGVA